METEDEESTTISSLSSEEEDSIESPPLAVISFQHCIKGRNIFCARVPATCPSCWQTLTSDGFTVAPFCIFAPWTSSLHAPCSIVLRTSTGSFLENYNGFEDLHVGLADTNGSVTHYDEDGIQSDSSWAECLSVVVDPASVPNPYNLLDLESHVARRAAQCGWDNMISIFKISWRKSVVSQRYDELANNCFDFVWAFVREYFSHFGDPNTADSLCQTKECFTDHFLRPLVEKALKFNRLVREVSRNGVLILDEK